MSSFTFARERIAVRPFDKASVERTAGELGIPFAAACILAVRNLTDPDVCRRFFKPSLRDFHDPFLFSDMEKATERIIAAIDRNETIAVYGDYDVDGISATAMLVRALRTLGAKCDYYLPHRLLEGYGISEQGVRRIAESGAALMITVDCGITAAAEVALALRSGIECIVTDHHEPREALPGAFAIIDPKVKGCGYPEKALAGVGVALKLCQALGRRTGRGDSFWEPYLDLAALGTAADIVPLTGENRIITRFGFERMPRTANPGLAALLDAQGIGGKPISTRDVVFQLAPCINAVGRIGDPRRGVELLLTDDNAAARTYSHELRAANVERRAIDASVWEEASRWVFDHCSPEKDFAIVIGNESWHAGVIGIVASKIVDRFHRPAILLSIGEGGLARGSGRSIPSLHLLDALQECTDLLQSFGGHAAAAGLNISSAAIDAFRSRFNEVVRSRVKPEDLVPVVHADAELPLSAVTPELFSCIKSMEPFGPGNMRPVLYCRNLRHRFNPRIVGGKHLKMTVAGDGFSMDAIGFNFGDRISELAQGGAVSLAFSLDENEWNGVKSLQMKVKGIAV